MSGNPVLEKSERIHTTGLQAIRDGTVKPFVMPNNLAQRYNCALLLSNDRSDQSPAGLFFKVVLPVQCAIIASGLRGLVCFRDYPAHCTLGEALTQNGTPAPDEFPLTLPSLASVVVTFSELVVDKSTLFLAVAEIPPEILEARVMLERFYADVGLRVTPIENLLHITVARITDLTVASLSRYADAMEQLRDAIHKYPVELSFSGLWRGSASRLLTRQ